MPPEGTKEKKMTEKELAEYEEKKLKLRKAMGANIADDIPGESMEAKQRRLALIEAVEGDDWSAVIDKQTQKTIESQLNLKYKNI